MKIIYIANARLPTEKAHGYQIVKMCESFARDNINVVLLHPQRRQAPQIGQQNIFEYYHADPVFNVDALPNLDIMTIERFLPAAIFRVAFFCHSFWWGFYATLIGARQNADLYLTRDLMTAFWLTRFGLPTVFEIHAIPNRWSRQFLRVLRGAPTLRLVISVTGFIKEHLVSMGFSREKTRVLSDGVDVEMYKDLPSRQECRRRLGLPENAPFIGYVGRFKTMHMEKGISVLIKAMGQIKFVNGHKPTMLCVGGPMDAIAPYRELIKRLGLDDNLFIFRDRVPNREVPLWIKACDIVTIPFGKEHHLAYYASPLKLFEYMAAGVPIVASDLPALKEVLKNGDNSLLVEPGDCADLANAIDRLLQDRDLASRLSAQAQQEAYDYDWDRRVKKILEWFRERQ